jgi:hypothetical protein
VGLGSLRRRALGALVRSARGMARFLATVRVVFGSFGARHGEPGFARGRAVSRAVSARLHDRGLIMGNRRTWSDACRSREERDQLRLRLSWWQRGRLLPRGTWEKRGGIERLGSVRKIHDLVGFRHRWWLLCQGLGDPMIRHHRAPEPPSSFQPSTMGGISSQAIREQEFLDGMSARYGRGGSAPPS